MIWEVKPPSGGLGAMVKARLAASSRSPWASWGWPSASSARLPGGERGPVGHGPHTHRRAGGATATVLQALNTVVSLAILAVLFAMLFKLLPGTDVAWRDVWFGAATTSLLFTIGKYLIGLYLARSSVSSTFGAAASVVILMIWI